MANRGWAWAGMAACIVISACAGAMPRRASAADAAPSPATSTLAQVRDRGVVRCAIGSANRPGLAQIDANGHWQGFYPDFCRAVATAVLGKPQAIDVVAATPATRFAMLKAREIDILAAGATWTLSRDSTIGARFVEPYLYDGQGFLAAKSLGATTLAQITGKICVVAQTTTEKTLEAARQRQGLKFTTSTFKAVESAYESFFNRECDAVTDDHTALASERASREDQAAQYVLLSDIITREPLGPYVRDDDPQWFSIVRWTLLAMIGGEEMGVGAANIDAVRTQSDNSPALRRFLGTDPGLGQGLGLDDDWAYRVVKMNGNYGEFFDRNLGKASPLKTERGLNALQRDGGLMYAPPFL